MIAALVLAGAMTVTTAGGAASAPDGSQVVLDFADHLLKVGEPYRAAGEYERFLFLCGSCERVPYAKRMLAESFRRGGRPRDAAARFLAVVEAHPTSPDAQDAARSAGEALEEAGAPGEASDAYQAFVRRFPANALAAEVWERGVRTALRAHDAARVKSSLAVERPAAAPAVDAVGLVHAIETESPRRRSPAVAGTLAALLPGAGHVYAGRGREAVMAFVVNALFISGAVIAYDHEQYVLAGTLAGAEIFWYGGNVVGAVNAADRFNRRAEERHWRQLERKWVPSAALSFRF